jgi:glycosyltransferase involved in cell wall biosynthesis
MQPINVLEVIRQGQVGGGESHLLDLVAGFDDTINPIILAFTPGQMIDTFRANGVKCYVIETSHPFDLRIIKQIGEIIKKESIQIIHAHGSRAASNVALIAKIKNIPLVYTVHGWSFHQDQSAIVSFLRAKSEKAICALSNQVICVSKSNQQTGILTFGLKKSVVIENGINLSRFNPNNYFKDIRKEFGFSDDDFIVGFIGRVTLQKDPINFIKSIAIAHKQNATIKALFVGEGDLKDEAMNYIKENSLEDIIKTSDFRNDIPDLLNAIDVFCLPSLWEGLSIALLEAMAMEKALIVTPTDGTKEVISDKQNGLIVKYSDPENLAQQYITYIKDDTLKERCEKEAKRLIEERFDSRRVSEKVSEIYKSFIKHL